MTLEPPLPNGRATGGGGGDTARTLCVGAFFGDRVALDSIDQPHSKGNFNGSSIGSTHVGSLEGSSVSSISSITECELSEAKKVATPTAASLLPSTDADSNSDLAPVPLRIKVTQAELGGETPHQSIEEEQRAIDILWNRLSEQERQQLSDSSMLTRHLRAEKGCIEIALSKTQAALKWRQSFGVNRMCEWLDLLKIENATGKVYVRGYDAEGRAYMYMRPSYQNTHNELDNMRHLVWNLEKAIACTKRKSVELGAAVPLEKINLVIDFRGFSLHNAPSMSASKYTLDILQKYYPERMYRAYAVNAPRIFQTFFTLIKAFIDPVSKEKIVFLTSADCQKLVSVTHNIDKLEPVVGGPETARSFDSSLYLSLVFDHSFDEYE